MSTFIWTVA